MEALKGASGPKTRKGGTATVPTPAVIVISNDIIDSGFYIRAQAFSEKYRLTPERARLVLSLLHGGRAND